MSNETVTRPATVRDFMWLADSMTTRRMEYEKQPSQTVWLAYRKARDELQGALTSGVVDFCSACGGVGERPVTVGHPPDDYWEEVHPCPDCDGSGNATGVNEGQAPSLQEVIAAALDALEDNDNHAATVILKTALRNAGVPAVDPLRTALEEILGVEVTAPEGGHEEVAEIHRIARTALAGVSADRHQGIGTADADGGSSANE